MTSSRNLLKIFGFFIALGVLSACGSKRAARTEQATFRVDSISVDKVSNSSFDSMGFASSRKFYFSACVNDIVNRGPIILTEFAIQDGKTERVVKTDPSGCLLWSETHEVNFKRPEKILHIQRTFVGRQVHAGKVTLELAFNPWSDSDVLYDLRKTQPVQNPEKVESLGFDESIDASLASVKPDSPEGSKGGTLSKGTFDIHGSRMNLSALSLDFKGLDDQNYRVTPLLSLQIAQRFLLSFVPQVVHADINGKPVVSTMTSGKLKMDFVLLKETDDQRLDVRDVVAAHSGFVNVRPTGDVAEEMSLRLTDLAAASSRMKLVVVLTPEASSGVQATVFSGQMHPMSGTSSSVQLVFEPNQKAEAISLVVKEFSQKQYRAIDVFQQKSGYLRVSQRKIESKWLGEDSKKEYDFYQWAQAYIDKKLSRADQGRFEKMLCVRVLLEGKDLTELPTATWYERLMGDASAEDKVISKCMKSAEKILELKELEVVDKLNNDVPKQIGFTNDFNLSLASSFVFSDNESDTSGSDFSMRGGVGASASAGVGASFAQPLGASKQDGPPSPLSFGANASASVDVHASVGKDWYKVVSKSESRGESVSGALVNSESISIHQIDFEIDLNAKRCLVFGPKSEFRKFMLGQSWVKGYYVCSQSSLRQASRQSYFLVNQSVTQSLFNDPESATGVKWRMLLRGSDVFEQFRRLTQEKDTYVKFQKIQVHQTNDQWAREFNMTQVYPGVLSVSP